MLANFEKLVLSRPGELGAPLAVCYRGRRIFESVQVVYNNTHYTYITPRPIPPGVTCPKKIDKRTYVSNGYMRGGHTPNNRSSTSPGGYYSGYSGSQQDVVLGSFMTAFNNSTINDRNIDPMQSLPLPNWSVNYSGLTKYKWTKKFLKSFIVRHGYSSTVSLNGMQTNLNSESDAQGNLTALDIDNNYIPEMQIQNVVISERFSPLIGIDANWIIGNHTLQTRFEYKKDRQATLALSNNQVTESLSEEIVIGTAARIKDVKLPFRNIKSSDVNIKFDFSFRDNLTVIRKIVENTNQATAGQKTVAIKISADYNITNNLTLMFYYDQNLNTPKVQTSYPTGNINTGFKIRFNLAGVQ